jgi:molybdopterin-binding protein
MAQDEMKQIEIRNMLNLGVVKRVNASGSKTIIVDISNLVPGVYLCSITTNQRVEYLKLIVQR